MVSSLFLILYARFRYNNKTYNQREQLVIEYQTIMMIQEKGQGL